MKVDGDGKQFRCSCGIYPVLCDGEYHDCATERSVDLQRRQVEALEKIAAALRQPEGR